MEMEKKTHVISGEAPESDSEEEINYPVISSAGAPKNIPQGVIVAGEAPESDEEHDANTGSSASISSLVSDSKLISSPNTKKHHGEHQYKSLLHRKLRERNVSLQKNVVELARQTVVNAGRELNATNQQLLRSQVQLQEAVSALHALHNNTTQLDSKLAAITTSMFLPYIKISD